MANEAMVIDGLMPRYDAVRVEHRLVEANLEETFAAALESDFMDSFNDSRVVRALFALRGAAEKTVQMVTGKEPPPQEPMSSMKISELPEHGEWVLLGFEPSKEIAFGAIGRFWSGETVWREISASEFADFAEPGYARLAANLSFHPFGENRTLVSYECRTAATDEEARRGFMRYWKALSPFIGVVLRAQLKTIAP